MGTSDLVMLLDYWSGRSYSISSIPANDVFGCCRCGKLSRTPWKMYWYLLFMQNYVWYCMWCSIIQGNDYHDIELYHFVQCNYDELSVSFRIIHCLIYGISMFDPGICSGTTRSYQICFSNHENVANVHNQYIFIPGSQEFIYILLYMLKIMDINGFDRRHLISSHE